MNKSAVSFTYILVSLYHTLLIYKALYHTIQSSLLYLLNPTRPDPVIQSLLYSVQQVFFYPTLFYPAV